MQKKTFFCIGKKEPETAQNLVNNLIDMMLKKGFRKDEFSIRSDFIAILRKLGNFQIYFLIYHNLFTYHLNTIVFIIYIKY